MDEGHGSGHDENDSGMDGVHEEEIEYLVDSDDRNDGVERSDGFLYVYGSSIRGVSGGGFNTDEGPEEEEEDRSAWILFDTDGDAGPEADSDANIVWFNGEEEE